MTPEEEFAIYEAADREPPDVLTLAKLRVAFHRLTQLQPDMPDLLMREPE